MVSLETGLQGPVQYEVVISLLTVSAENAIVPDSSAGVMELHYLLEYEQYGAE